MRTRQTTLVTSCDEVGVCLPTSWSELSEADLHVWSRIVTSTLDVGCALVSFFFHLSGWRMEREFGDGSGYLVRTVAGWRCLSVEQLGAALCCLDFLETPPECVLRLSSIDGMVLVSDDLQGLAFERYLACENFFQAYLEHGREESLLGLLGVVCREGSVVRLSESVSYLTLLWYGSVKGELVRLFPYLFQGVSEGGVSQDMRDVTNAQIRALTGGDITKERIVLESDTWRALTELNEKAREVREHRLG